MRRTKGLRETGGSLPGDGAGWPEAAVRVRSILAVLLVAVIFTGCTAAGKDARQEGGENASEQVWQEGTEEQGSQPGAGGQMEEGESIVGEKEETGETAAGGVAGFLNFDRGSIALEETLAYLDQEEIRYAGYYNVSGERLDLTLEDGTALLFLQVKDDWGNPLDRYELMMRGTELYSNGFEEDYLCCFDVIADEPYYPDLSAEIVDESTLWALSQTELALVRNQIYAVRGRRFQDPFMDAAFRLKNWYEPKYDGAEFDARNHMLTETEQANLRKVLEIENSMHYRSINAESYRFARPLLSGSWVDLDGDGSRERIVYTWEEGEDEIGTMELDIFPEDSVKASGSGIRAEEMNMRPHCYLISMDGVRWQIVVAADGPSGDYTCDFYGYERGGIVERGRINSYAEGLEAFPDRISAPVEQYHFQCQPVWMEYELKGEKLVQIGKDTYEYRGNTVVALVQAPLLAEKAGEETCLVLEPGDRVVVCAGDLSEWVLLEKEATKERGWLNVVECECRLADGSNGFSGDWFEGLTFYG